MAPAPAKTVYVQAPAAPVQPAALAGLRPVGIGTQGEEVYAGPNTSDAFALNVEQSYAHSGATDQFNVYSPVTGQNYLMTSVTNGANMVVVTGGNNALVEFDF